MPNTSKSVDWHMNIPIEEMEEIDRYISERYHNTPPPRVKAYIIRHLIAEGIKQERKKMGAK